MAKFSWCVMLLCAIAAGLILASTFVFGMNDQRQAAIATLATGMVAVPYVFTRAIEGLGAGQVSWVRVVEMPTSDGGPAAN